MVTKNWIPTKHQIAIINLKIHTPANEHVGIKYLRSLFNRGYGRVTLIQHGPSPLLLEIEFELSWDKLKLE
jgi:hypothetical protein